MMGVKALEGLQPSWYTPAGQDDGDKPTRFRLKPLDGDQFAEVADHVRPVDGVLKIDAQGQLLCLRYGLADWENFEDSSGPVRFQASNFRLIPYLTRTELSTKIFTMSSIDGEQEKN